MENTGVNSSMFPTPAPSDFDFDAWLLSDERATIYHQSKVFSIIRHVVGALSLISSIILICIIVRSHIGLSSTFNRLLFGLCVSDVLSSVAHTISSAAGPKDLDYAVWNARGNAATCDASGFIQFVGMNLGLFYNASLCLNSLAIVRFKKKEKYIREKIEPFLHWIPIVYCITGSIILAAMKNFNQSQTCLPNFYNPKHCIGYEDGVIPDGYTVPCGRGGNTAVLALTIIHYPPLFGSIIVIVGSMFLMHRTVRKTEQAGLKYGRSTLRLMKNQTPEQNSINTGTFDDSKPTRSHKSDHNSDINRNAHIARTSFSSLNNRERKKSKRKSSLSRVVLNKAFAYSMAWAATYTMSIVVYSMEQTKKNITFPVIVPYTATQPMQGILNFLIFIYPRVKSAKSSKKDNLTWPQALKKALASRGGKRPRNSSLASRSRRASATASALSHAIKNYRSKKSRNNADIDESNRDLNMNKTSGLVEIPLVIPQKQRPKHIQNVSIGLEIPLGHEGDRIIKSQPRGNNSPNDQGILSATEAKNELLRVHRQMAAVRVCKDIPISESQQSGDADTTNVSILESTQGILSRKDEVELGWQISAGQDVCDMVSKTQEVGNILVDTMDASIPDAERGIRVRDEEDNRGISREDKTCVGNEGLVGKEGDRDFDPTHTIFATSPDEFEMQGDGQETLCKE